MTAGVVWITGLAGAGKSTVAAHVRDRLLAMGQLPVLLDGDALRAMLPYTPGYSRDERLKLARYYARLARELAEQGHLVICATVSLFHEVHEWNRRAIPGYIEVWLRVPVAQLRDRGCRTELYETAEQDVVGMDTLAEFPQGPDLVIDNYGPATPEAAADRIIAALDVSGRSTVGNSP
ncbi:adenylylsulfate kinase-like enzyme [Kibdelosporangium banguiense]|uniref:Adenylylsulfate kinase-like enzyme n=1 Tax=Kibdelosporangium banguiense TaxID=1365924 RepID=A0ABS4TKR1_9PSEU|nr:adenylyl-sulfate kinase [Kibdelosporangium banguiense]MBP2325008.1 adenylylsulfate kinase-like enzyme [Kibdelosporangium banguiense]